MLTPTKGLGVVPWWGPGVGLASRREADRDCGGVCGIKQEGKAVLRAPSGA